MMKNCFFKISVFLIILLFLESCLIPVNANFLIEKKPISSLNFLKFNQNITNLLKQYHVPGLSACIIKNDEVVWSKGYGYYNKLRFLKKPDGDTIYGTGCITTTITATALLQLYEKGLFDLDDDVNNYLDFKLRNPDYPNKPINFTMLLTHQSSLSKFYTLNFFSVLKNFLGLIKKPYHLLDKVLVPGGKYYNPNVWLNNCPGENASYSAVGITILAYLVELLSGQSFMNYCKENIFKPLNMTNSDFNAYNSNRKNLAVPYYPLKLTLKNKNFSFFIRIPRGRGYNAMIGSNGFVTTTNDLSHFLIAHMNGGVWNGNRILNESTVKLMHKIHVYNVSDMESNYNLWGYGFGWLFYNDSGTILQGHGGEDGWGSASSMICRDSDNIGVIMLFSAWSPEQYKVRGPLKQELFKIAERL